MKRLFIGVPVSLKTVDALAGTTESLARRAQQGKLDARWLAPATYHVTLKFLGSTRDETVEAVADGLRRACAGVEPIKVTAARLGAFPSATKATVVWGGIEDPGGKLGALAARVDTEMAEIGFPREKRRFHAHVTIGRLRAPGDVSEVLLPLAEQVFGESRIDEVILYESKTKSTGSEYTPLITVPLNI